VKLGRLNLLISVTLFIVYFFFNYMSFLLVQNVGLHIALVFSCSINTIVCHCIHWITVINRKTTQMMVLVYVVSLTEVSYLSCHSCMFL